MRPPVVPVLLALALALGACRSVATPDATSAPPLPSAGIARPDPSAVDAGHVADVTPREVLSPLPWGTRPADTGVLFPIADGMCIHGRVFVLEGDVPLFAYGMGQGLWSRGGTTTAAVVAPTGLEPQKDQGLGRHIGGSPETIGGSYPDHLFAVFDETSRMVGTASELRAGSASAASWSLLVRSRTSWLGDDATPAEKADPTIRILRGPHRTPEGGWLFAEQDTLQENDLKESYRFRLLRPDGTMPANAKVPGADLAGAAFHGGIGVLRTGEVVGVDASKPKLVRWSPVKPVDDLALPGITLPKERGVSVVVRAGATHAWAKIDAKLFVYDGEKVAAHPVPLEASASWALAEDDAALVATSRGVVLRALPDGTTREEPVPVVGPSRVVADKGEAWLVVAKQGPRGSDALLRRTPAGAWEAVPLPEPPFGNEQRSPLSVEEITVASKGDVFVNVRRIEKGWGWSQTEPYRTIYRTKRPREVMRCQDVRHDTTGVGLWSWPPAAEASCTTPVVTVLTEPGPKPSADYPNVRAKLKGKTEYGETLSFLTVEGRGYLNLAVPMSDVGKARALATYLSKALDVRADVHCGTPTPARTLVLDVAKGTFRAP